MRINSINITKRYSNNGYDCRVTIDSDFQQVVLLLDDAHTQRVIDVVADLIIDGSRIIAEQLSKQALDHKAIEHKSA